MYVDVILPLALPGLLTYKVPAGDENAVQEGARVIVPLRRRSVNFSANSDLKPFRAFLDDSVPKQPTLKLKSDELYRQRGHWINTDFNSSEG